MGRKKHPEHVNHERWLVSYADFITLLFAFFVVMFAVSQVDSRKLGRFVESVNVAFQYRGLFPNTTGSALQRGGGQAGEAVVPPIVANRPMVLTYSAPSPRAQAIKEWLELKIGEAGLANQVAVRFDPAQRGVAVGLPERIFFREGSATLRGEPLAALRELAAAVRDEPIPVIVEGHTDDEPTRSLLFASNWELSAARAARVVDYLVEEVGFEPERLTAVGFAHVRPLVDNATADNREANRRVDLLLVTENSGGT